MGTVALTVAMVAMVVAASCSGTSETNSHTAGPAASTFETTSTVAQTTTPTTAATTTTVFVPRSFSIAATGDLLTHTAVARQALTDGGGAGYSFAAMLDPVRSLLSEPDLAICHMETPLSKDDTDISGYPMFNAPHELARDAAGAGYDACSTASNHSLDRGFAGIIATLDHLDAAGLHHAGTARTQQEAETPTAFDVAGVQVAHLAYTYGSNGIPLPAEAPWALNLIDQTKMLADAAMARVMGAEFVIVSVQWGNEYQREPTAQQRSVAQALLESPDVDLIIGHHVHVVQPVEKVGDKYVAYGLGNFLSNQSGGGRLPAGTQDGVIMHFDVNEAEPGVFKVIGATFTPTYVDRPAFRIVPTSPSTYPDSYQRTVEAITLLGFEPVG